MHGTPVAPVVPDLKTTAHKILAMTGCTDAQAAAAFPAFSSEHPDLFRMLRSGKCDVKILDMILDAHRRVSSGASSQDEASEQVGQSLFDSFVPAHVRATR